MEYLVIDKRWNTLLRTTDVVKLKEFLDSNKKWDSVVKRESVDKQWIFCTDRNSYMYNNKNV